MPIQHAVLALLTGEPSHGYQLKAEFERAIGPQWGELNIGHLYQVLERLSRDGYVNSERHEQVDRPDRRIYSITESGNAELAAWLTEPALRSGYRDELFFKLVAASRAGESILLTFAHAQRAHLMTELKNLTQLRSEAADPCVRLLLQSARLHVEADLRTLEAAQQEAIQLVGLPTRMSSDAAVAEGHPMHAPETA